MKKKNVQAAGGGRGRMEGMVMLGMNRRAGWEVVAAGVVGCRLGNGVWRDAEESDGWKYVGNTKENEENMRMQKIWKNVGMESIAF